MQWNLPERPPSQNRDWFLRQIAISETSHKRPPNQNPDWFLRQIAISETSRKRPPLLNDHLTKIPIGSSVKLLLVKLPVSGHLL